MNNHDFLKDKIKEKPKLNFKMENIYIDDIISDVPSKEEKSNNKIADCFLLYQKQRASLNALEKNASKGDRVSLKIYNHLHE